jgi:hypothetical protein
MGQMRELIFIHGRSQQNKDAAELKKIWIAALKEGISNAGLELDIEESNIHFPFYGNTLIQLSDQSETVESIAVKGGKDTLGDAEAHLLAQVVKEALDAKGIAEAQVSAELAVAGIAVKKKGPLNWSWVLTGLRMLNDLGFGTLALELIVRDVYHYLYDPSIKEVIDTGVAGAFTGVEAIIVAHSLGTVIAYSVLNEKGTQNKWKVPVLVTLGSPLAIHAVNRLLESIRKPSCVETWFNGRDPKDMVALFPLAPDHFPNIGIIAKDIVENRSSNHHGIEEYLRDVDVARWIHSALTA